MLDQKKIEILHKEIDLIQACINRMAQNSFFIKGWAISIIAVVLALSKDTNLSLYICVILILVLLSFWYLDAFFLQTERKYRKMYEFVITERHKQNTDYLYDLNPNRFTNKVPSLYKTMWSVTSRIFYGVPMCIILGWVLYEYYCFGGF